MKGFRRLTTSLFGMIALALTTSILPAQREGPEWNAFQLPFDETCYTCSEGAIGYPSLCPCRILPPVVVS